MENLICVKNNQPVIKRNMAETITNVEKRIKELEKIKKQYRKALFEIMQQMEFEKIQDEELGLTITYTKEENYKEKFHMDEFQKDYPELYKKYSRYDGKKEAYITIRVK